ncbi:MAG: ammonium transporter [Ilumatobacteraceae bacterium]|jgi:Amt family ammonium transporter
MGVILLGASPVLAEEATPIALDDTQMILDNTFVFLAGVLVIFMQAGFALLAAGLTSAKNVANMMMKNMMDMALGVLVFGLVGYHIAYSGSSFFGFSWLWGGYEAAPTTDYSLMLPVDFFFQAAFAAAAATIVAGAMAGRTQFKGYMIYTVLLTGLIYPIVVNWQWGGGWLSELGFQDFAGSTLVHSVGGWAALMGAIIVGPRIGKFGPDGKPRAIPGHNMVLAITGVFILFVGWFGFNPGSQLAADVEVPRIAVNTLVAAAAGGVAAMIVSWMKFKKPDVSFAGNGILGGLVSITAGAWALDGFMSVVAGFIGGIIVTFSVLLLERLRVDDPVGAVSVHGVCGAWGTIAVGLFANGNAPLLDEGSNGLFFGGGTELLVNQVIGVVAVAAFVIVTTGIMFTIIKKIGLLRVTEEEEMAGLDIAEHGVAGYGPDVLPSLVGTSSGGK